MVLFAAVLNMAWPKFQCKKVEEMNIPASRRTRCCFERHVIVRRVAAAVVKLLMSGDSQRKVLWKTCLSNLKCT